ncbi:ESX-3 secretion system protein EccA3 [Calidithermus roseus]|uniref:ESX-3 secretion system protein EccA3 n=1 Tax=Calidithermus roseus TaxID=1644118 RepID=A0A399EFS6_9DEIN|nr:ATP-binding protein [Calidithermus roseus]RIH82808.1 ESX-3 secretion system protein EccA3 [Calidithermus roseus]
MSLCPSAPLRRWGLIEIHPRPDLPLTAQPIRLSEPVLHFLLGVDSDNPADLDPVLAGTFVLPAAPALVPSQQERADRISSAWEGEAVPVQLLGDPQSVRAIAASACSWLGLRAFGLPAERLLERDPEDLARRLGREARLRGAAWLLEAGYRPEPPAQVRLGELLERLVALETPVLLSARERLALPGVRWTLEVDKPTPSEQAALWRERLVGELSVPENVLNEALERVVAQFDLEAEAIAQATQQALLELRYHLQRGARLQAEDLRGALWAACRSHSRGKLERVAAARRMEVRARREELVLPEALQKTLSEIVAHVRYRHLVHERQGFRSGERGRGVTVLFSGPSGTGKTTAAEVLARELDLDLYRVDLSLLVSKYIGETEKNLGEVFDAAEDGGSVLLFDEADAVFGKRSDVQDSHDRYANLEVSYLLQRMEQYRGLAILTTNLENSIDEAFIRRLRFIVRFERPRPLERAEIWRRVIPAGLHAGLDFERLSRLELTGGNITNVALHAAFKAAAEGEPLGMRHLREAAGEELSKLKRLRPRELEDWN